MEEIGLWTLRKWFKLFAVLALSFSALGWFKSLLTFNVYGSLNFNVILGWAGLLVVVMLYKNWV